MTKLVETLRSAPGSFYRLMGVGRDEGNKVKWKT